VSGSAVLGWGGYLPPQVVTNDDLAAALGRSGAELTATTGVVRRHQVAEGLGPSDVGREASSRALAAAGLEAGDVDLIVFATMSPDLAFPGSGCFLQDKLGCRTIGALDVRAQCAGFLFALATGDQFVRARAAERVLVVGAEVHSTAMEYAPRAAGVTPYFGDGAGAVVLGAGREPGVLATVLHSDPTGLERFWCEFPASRHHPARMELEHLHAGGHYYRLDAEALHAAAEPALVAVAGEALERAGVAADQLALAVMHYLDPRVARRAGAALGVAPERVLATAEQAGHVAAAGIPLALAGAIDAGRVGPGDVVCCAAFGAGLSWAGAVLRL
jgi:3-oxoacyl-[acyl-carrier-protein] synthase-3